MYRVVFWRINENRCIEMRLNGLKDVIHWLSEQEIPFRQIVIEREDV